MPDEFVKKDKHSDIEYSFKIAGDIMLGIEFTADGMIIQDYPGLTWEEINEAFAYLVSKGMISDDRMKRLSMDVSLDENEEETKVQESDEQTPSS